MGACESVRLCFIVVWIVDSFFKNPLLNYLEKATPTHPSPKDTIGISCFGVIEQMKLNAWLMCSLWQKNQFLAILYTFSRLVYGWKSILNYWIFWKEELFPCSSNIVFQISWLRIMETSLKKKKRIMETMKMVMMWALF